MDQLITEQDRGYSGSVIRRLYNDGEIGKIESWEKHFAQSKWKAYVSNYVIAARINRANHCGQEPKVSDAHSRRNGNRSNAAPTYSNDTAAAVYALINSYERSLMRGELIAGYNILKDASDVLLKLSSRSCAAKLMLNTVISIAALAQEGVGRNRTIQIQSIIRETMENRLEYNQEHRKKS